MSFLKAGRFLVFFVLLDSCTNNNSTESVQKPVLIDTVYTIQHFLSKHQLIEFPFVHNMDDDREIGWPIDAQDTIFFPSNALIAGYLPDTSTYFGFIHYRPAGYVAPNLMAYHPMIRTFTKEGKQIAEEDLFDVNSNDCYSHSFETFMNSQSEYTVASVSVKQWCREANEPTDVNEVEVSFIKQKLFPDGTIGGQEVHDTIFYIDTALVGLMNATTKKYVIDNPLITQTLWIGWLDYSNILYDCRIISKTDGCEWHSSDTARLYMEDGYKYDDEIGGDHFLHQYHTYSYIQTILIDMRYRDKTRLVLNEETDETNCGLSGEVMHGVPWF